MAKEKVTIRIEEGELDLLKEKYNDIGQSWNISIDDPEHPYCNGTHQGV